jgi:Cd2+/Zn2+-exporting ATPase
MSFVYSLNGIDCANCALKIERKIKKLKGVSNVSLGFITQKLSLSAGHDPTRELETLIKKIDKNIILTRREV